MNGGIQIFAGDIRQQSSVLEHQIGSIGFDEYGDLYRYAKVGAANISAGKLQTAPAPKTNHHNCATVAAVTANGRSKQVTLTLGATAAVANEYAFGKLNANASTPVGQTYTIAGHPAAGSAASLLVTVDTPFITSITTSSKFTLVHNAWNGVIEAAVQTTRAAGVPLIPMTAANFGWLKTRGSVSLLADQAISLGSLIVPSGSVAGAVIAISGTYGTGLLTTAVGQASILAGVDAEYRAMDLTID